MCRRGYNLGHVERFRQMSGTNFLDRRLSIESPDALFPWTFALFEEQQQLNWDSWILNVRTRSIRLCHSIPTQIPIRSLSLCLFVSRANRDTDQSNPIPKQQIKLTCLRLTFEDEGIPFVVASLWFDQLHENVEPPLWLLLTRALDKRRSIGRLNKDRVDVSRDLFRIGHLNHVRHVDARLRNRLRLHTRDWFFIKISSEYRFDKPDQFAPINTHTLINRISQLAIIEENEPSTLPPLEASQKVFIKISFHSKLKEIDF